MQARVHAVRNVALLLMLTVSAPSRASDAGRLSALSWMAGSWSSEFGGKRQEEHWMAPRGDMMVGMHRDSRAGKPGSFEYFRIQARADGVFYLTQPGGAPVTEFKLVEQGRRRVVFENKAHDFPQRIIYWQQSPRELRAMIAGTLNGKADSLQWRWTRGKLTP